MLVRRESSSQWVIHDECAVHDGSSSPSLWHEHPTRHTSVTTENVSSNPSPQTRIYFTGAVETNIEDYLQTASIEAYPNPSTGIFQLQYDLLQSTDVQIYIYNSMGQRIQQVVNGQQSAGNQTETINLTQYPTGVYFAEMILDEKERIVHKLMVQ